MLHIRARKDFLMAYAFKTTGHACADVKYWCGAQRLAAAEATWQFNTTEAVKLRKVANTKIEKHIKWLKNIAEVELTQWRASRRVDSAGLLRSALTCARMAALSLASYLSGSCSSSAFVCSATCTNHQQSSDAGACSQNAVYTFTR